VHIQTEQTLSVGLRRRNVCTMRVDLGLSVFRVFRCRLRRWLFALTRPVLVVHMTHWISIVAVKLMLCCVLYRRIRCSFVAVGVLLVKLSTNDYWSPLIDVNVTSWLTRTASRCRSAYILPLFFLSSSFSTPNLWGH